VSTRAEPEAWVDIGAVDEFVDARPRTIYHQKRAIGIIRYRGRFLAIRGLCPHQLGPLSEGPVRSKLKISERSNELEVDADSPVIACPWHGWEFDVQTGRMIADQSFRVQTYAVRVRGTRVLLNTGRGAVDEI
jgi:nitrite reductase (NADH) small subunit